MKLPNFFKKPLIAAIVAAVTIGVPVGALYMAGVTRPAPTPAAPAAAPVTPVPAAANPAAMLPDFSSMVQKYGPAVVNITVVTKVNTGWNSQGDDSGDDNG